MASHDPSIVGQLQEGMDVLTSDGVNVGKVVQLWVGSEPAERLLTSAIQERQMSYEAALANKIGVFLEVHPGAGGDPMYIPWQIVDNAEGGAVHLLVTENAAEASEWRRRPAWATAQ
ncbi:MAG: PRC-barrel domain-containing protein [Chloroflexota bacterium]|nr:PRC-barrel domain-containing protein [Chloroflexota bacterium]